MQHLPEKATGGREPRARRGAITVELALVCSLVFLPLFFGMVQASRYYDMHNEMAMAIRSGARLASMDREGILGDGQSTNDKVSQDIRNMLNANGFPPDEVEVHVAEWWDGFDYHEDTLVPFDLDDPANDNKLFQIRVDLSYYSDDSYTVLPGMDKYVPTSFIVFRNGTSSLVQ